MNVRYKIAISIVYLFSCFSLSARPERELQIPNGTKNSCVNCHNASNFALNSFGQQVFNNLTSPDALGKVIWEAIYALDADGDGFTNGQELQDPDGTWVEGLDNPGDISLVTNPGDANDFPTSVELSNLTKLEVSVFPNPSVEFINIALNSPYATRIQLDIVDINGKMVQNFEAIYLTEGENNIQLNFDINNQQPSGVYFINIMSDKFFTREKFAIQK